MKVWAVVPARGGSKGVPGKNIRMLAGKPLIVHTLEAALASSCIDELTVSTDSPEIAAVCEQHGVPVPRLRPAELAADHSRTQDAILHELSLHDGGWDYILLLQPTAPLRTAEDIERSLALAEMHDATSVVSFTRLETHHPYYIYRLHEGQDGARDRVEPLCTYPAGMPRQEFPPMLYRNGAIYLAKMSWFREYESFISPDTVPYLMPEAKSVNLDTEEDFALAEWRLQKGEL